AAVTPGGGPTSFSCTASNKSRASIGSCSPRCTSPRRLLRQADDPGGRKLAHYSCGEREPASARRFAFTRADDCFSRFARKSSSLVLAVGSLQANLHQRSPSSEVLGRGVVGRQILLPARPWARVCRMASVMRVAIMPVPPEAPARRYRWSGSIADDAACDQANRACDEGTCECAHCSVSESLLRMCGGRRAGYSRDR